jgi:GNAT superfamily N-acetyltransferase
MNSDRPDNIVLRDARREDASLILSFIRELADYEKLSHEVVASEGDIEHSLFGPSPRAFCVIAEGGGEPAGFALCFYNYSTFQGRAGIYLEDLYVRPAFRGQGIGKRFFRYLAQRALEEDCGRIQWWVLNWNEPSIEFYKSMKAVPMDEWTVYRLEGQSIEDLAKKAA